ncbi:hypothetical protein [uncultured Nostoc sp.]
MHITILTIGAWLRSVLAGVGGRLARWIKVYAIALLHLKKKSA